MLNYPAQFSDKQAYVNTAWFVNRLFFQLDFLRIIIFRSDMLHANLVTCRYKEFCPLFTSYLPVIFLGFQMQKTIYMYTLCSFTQMQLHISGHLVVCSYDLYELVHFFMTTLIGRLFYFFSLLIFFFDFVCSHSWASR